MAIAPNRWVDHLAALVVVTAATVPTLAWASEGPSGERPAGADRKTRIAAPAVVALPTVDAELAGLPPGSSPVLLRWERVYWLALIRARSSAEKRRPGPAAALDPEVLALEATRHEVSDFERFRNDFLAGPAVAGGAGFHDPSGAFLDLLGQLEAVENARRSVAWRQRVFDLTRQLVQGAASGITQFDLDRVNGALQQARLDLSSQLTQYRDQLDALKVELGLSPRAAVAADRNCLLAFRTTFDQAERWLADPRREIMELPRMAGQLPPLEDVSIDALSLLGVRAKSGRLEEMLRNAADLADRNARARGRALLPAAELRLRTQLRRLLETAEAYDTELNRFVARLRVLDLSWERLIAPRVAGVVRQAATVADVLAAEAALVQCEDRLVALWTTYHKDRLELLRDLGTLPYADWLTFYAHLEPQPRWQEPVDSDPNGPLPEPPGARPAPPPAPTPAPPAPRVR